MILNQTVLVSSSPAICIYIYIYIFIYHYYYTTTTTILILLQGLVLLVNFHGWFLSFCSWCQQLERLAFQVDRLAFINAQMPLSTTMWSRPCIWNINTSVNIDNVYHQNNSWQSEHYKVFHQSEHEKVCHDNEKQHISDISKSRFHFRFPNAVFKNQDYILDFQMKCSKTKIPF